jgi:hypothetical protein
MTKGTGMTRLAKMTKRRRPRLRRKYSNPFVRCEKITPKNKKRKY